MLRYIFAIFFPLNSIKRALPFFGVILSLSFGIGIFWMVQSLMDNYLEGLVHLLLQSKEEIEIRRNPERSYMTEDELEEEFFSGKKLDYLERTTIPPQKILEIKKALSNVIDNALIQGIVRQSNCEFVLVQNNSECIYQPLIVAADLSSETRILPIFDSLSNEEINALMNSQGDKIPFISSTKLFPQVKQGDTITLRYNNETKDYYCVGIIKQHELFEMPLFIVSVNSFEKISGNKIKYTSVAIRTQDIHSQDIAKKIEDVLGKGYIVNHWSELLKKLNSVFNSINLIITIVISSLFLISFLFSIATFDILIKKRRKHLALLLALGLSPQKIRRGLFCVSGVIGGISLLTGLVLAKLLLMSIQYTPLKHMLSQMYVDNFSLCFKPMIIWSIIIMTAIVTLGSVAVSARRIFKIDPIQDLKQ